MARSQYERLPRGGSDQWDFGPSGAIITKEFFDMPILATGGGLKRWDGAAWVNHPLKAWDGAAFVQYPLKYWNGTTWVLSHS